LLLGEGGLLPGAQVDLGQRIVAHQVEVLLLLLHILLIIHHRGRPRDGAVDSGALVMLMVVSTLVSVIHPPLLVGVIRVARGQAVKHRELLRLNEHQLIGVDVHANDALIAVMVSDTLRLVHGLLLGATLVQLLIALLEVWQYGIPQGGFQHLVREVQVRGGGGDTYLM
jgi:hypothetical protein